MRLLIIAASTLLVACSASPPPPAQPPAAKPAAAADQHTQLRDAIQAPIDKAKSADDIQKQGDEKERQAIDDSGG